MFPDPQFKILTSQALPSLHVIQISTLLFAMLLGVLIICFRVVLGKKEYSILPVKVYYGLS